MFCNKCGYELKPQMVFCPKCGTQIRRATPPTHQLPQKQKRKFKPGSLEYGLGVLFLIWVILWIRAGVSAFDALSKLVLKYTGASTPALIALIMGILVAEECLWVGLGFFGYDFRIIKIGKELDFFGRCASNLLGLVCMVALSFVFAPAYFSSLKWSTLLITVIGYAITMYKSPNAKNLFAQKH